MNLLQTANRRAFLGRSLTGLGTVALASLLDPASRSLGGDRDASGAPAGLHLPPKAKRVIYLFQAGAPSRRRTAARNCVRPSRSAAASILARRPVSR